MFGGMGDICSCGIIGEIPDAGRCLYPKGTVNVVDEKEVSFEVGEEDGQFSLECD